jgi:hypothetical protein
MSLLRTPHGRAPRRKSALVVLLAAVFAMFAAMSFGAAGASAAEEPCALPGSEFQGADGNQNTPGVEQVACEALKRPTTRDWQSDVLAKKVVASEDPQASDNELSGKENVPNKWTLGAHVAGVTPPKDNIITAWSEVDQQAASTFLYLAFQREGATGTTFLTFELNQVKGEWENEAKSMIPCRTTGDLLISYEVSGSSIGEVVVQEWKSTKSKSVTIEGKTVECGTEGELKGGAVKVEPSAGVQGAMNAATIENFLPDKVNGTPTTIGKNLFGEAALNLVEVLKEANINPCFDFGQIWMHTRSSLATSSELHDYVSPVPLLVQSCSISGRKFDDANANKKHDAGEAYLEGWKIQLLNATTKAVVQEATTGSEGSYTFTKVGPGAYLVQEVGQSGWTCDVPGEGTACQYEVTIDSEHLNVTERDFGNVPTSKVTTSQEPKSGVVGSKFGDSATVEGPATGGAPTPTGEVEFTLYNEEGCKGVLAGPIKVTLSGVQAAIPTVSKVTLSNAGTYYWVATYGGDANNAKASSGCNDEPVTVEKAKPSISTKAVSPVTVGEKIHDTATLSGLVDPTGEGTVTFKLYSDEKCETEVFKSTSAGIKANGEVPSGEFTPSSPGTYYWTAKFSGDKNNEAAESGCKAANESSVVNKTKPGITTEATTLVIVGETVTFRLFSDEKCETEVAAAKSTSGAVVGSGTVEVSSGEYATTATGTYFWIAEYSGDKNNSPVTSGCKDANESTVVNPAKPAIATKAVASVTIGEPIHDTATVVGLAEPTGEGTITFKLYSDEKCDTEVFKSTSAGITANGEVESGEFTPTSTGAYYWTARFSGDKNNEAIESGCKAANESSLVNPAKPAVTTKAVTPVTVGEPVKDTASISGLVDPTGEGTITFKLYSDEKCDTEVFTSTSAGITVNGEVPSGEFTPTSTGTYYWTAKFSGDKNNEAAESGCKAANESSLVNPAKPAVSTKAVTPVTVGEAIHDTATLSGLVDPTGEGTVTFRLYSDEKCETEVFNFTSAGIKANGDVESGEFTPTSTGTYYWTAKFSGDKNNEAAASGCKAANESSLVNPAKPAVSTKAVTPVTVGEAIHDTATISGLVDPTGEGTITFKLYSDEKCETEVFNFTSAGVKANGDVESGGFTPSSTGTYYWTAKFSGDKNNEAAESGCKAANESSVVNTTKPAITTEATTLVIVGEKIKDTAKLAGLVNASTGTVTFKLFSDGECHNEVAAAKSTSGAVLGSGTVEVFSGEYTTTATGTYYWIAEYSGDNNNSPVTSGCKDTNESTVVESAKPAIATKAVSSAIVGEPIHDTATLVGLVEPTGEGTVTFKLYSDESCTTEVFHSTSAGIKANGDVESGEFTPTSTGTYYWTAKFSGDTNNVAVESGCKAANESSLVKPASPSISTKATPSVIVGAKIEDTATLEGLVDQTGEGKVTFKLYSNEHCEGKPLFESTSGGIGPSTVSSEEFTTTATGTYYWVASYSGDKNNEATESGCKDAEESSAVKPASPGITTKALSPVTVGEKIHDTATLTGLVNPDGTGKVTFKAYGDSECNTAPLFESTSAGITENGDVPSGEYTTKTATPVYWVAFYSGDSNNEPAATKCGDPGETSEVEKTKPAITTKATPLVTVGENIKDTATLTGLVNASTGTVTFKLFSDGECHNEVAAAKSTSGAVLGSGTVEVSSGEYTTTATGAYYWIAEYSGDNNNSPVTSGCKDTNESTVVEPAKPGITTKAVTPVTVGAKIHDTATLTGLVNPDGTGTVTFKLYSDSGCATKVFESTNPTSGGVGANGDVLSSEYTTTAAGTYYWVASYSGDSNNMSASTTCKDAEETSVVEKTEPGITTKATPEVTVGENIQDTATLTGLVNATSGTVTFKLFSDSSCSTEVAAAKSTSAAVVGSGTIDVPSGEYKTTTAGTYFWIASYSGDSSNGPVTSGCKDTNESTVVNKAQPGITTKAVTPVTVGEKVHDTATLTGLVNPDGKGTITFRLFAESSCDSTPVFESTSAGISANGDVPSGEYTAAAAGTYYWTASYNGDSNNKPVSSGCKADNETSVVEKAKPAISTTASAGVILGGSLHDTAHLTGGFNPTGKIVFKLYAASDTSCATVLKSVETEVNKGAGDYESPSATVAVGSYQWVAEYSGDANNVAATTSCNDPNEQASVTEHPGITVIKEQQVAGSGAPFTTGPLTATVGQQINYRITVTNTGDVPLTLSFSDPHCDAGTITGPTGNLNPDGTLPPAGVAQYFCSHVLQVTDVPQFTNAATVTGQPPSGPPVSGTGSVVANVAKQVVAAVCSVSESSIVLHGVGGSVRQPFTVRISSLGIKQITFYLDKRKLKTLTSAQAKNGQFTIKIDPRKLRYGAHKVSITTVMSDTACASLARAGVFVHPHPPIVKPKFTG